MRAAPVGQTGSTAPLGALLNIDTPWPPSDLRRRTLPRCPSVLHSPQPRTPEDANADHRRPGAYLVQRHTHGAAPPSPSLHQGRTAGRDGGSRRRRRGDPPPKLGPQLQPGRHRGRPAAPGQVRHPRAFPPPTGRRAARWSTPGRPNPVCLACVTPWSVRSSRPGTRTARWTGCGRRRSGPALPVALLASRFLPIFRGVAERHPGL
jgi:hypothetical protein